MAQIKVLMTVTYWRLSLYLQNIIEDYSYKIDDIHYCSEKKSDEPKHNILKNDLEANWPSQYWIVHGADYVLDWDDLRVMVETLEADPKAHSIGIHPYNAKMFPATTPVDFTHTRRIMVYKADLLKESFDEGVRRCLDDMKVNYSDWTSFVAQVMNEKGYHPLQATRARMSFLNDDHRFYTMIKDVHGNYADRKDTWP